MISRVPISNAEGNMLRLQIPGPCSQRCCLVCVGRGPGTMFLDDPVTVGHVEQPLGSRQCRCVSSPGPELSDWFLEVLTLWNP